MKNVLKPPDKTVLTPLELTTVASETDAAIQKKIFCSGITTLIISNNETSDIMKIVKSLQNAGLLKKGLAKQLKMKQRNKKVHFSAGY